ncbi:hypothetical protein RB594_008662 [Gaeumannomyces avenae]
MSDLGKSRHGIPDVVMVKIDKYVDSLAPEIQPKVAGEIDEFQSKTIARLEDMVVDAFRALFDRKDSGSRSLGDAPPDEYGIGGLPFANEIVALTQSFSKVADGASDDIREIFNLTEGSNRGGGGGGGDDDHQQSRGGGGSDSFREGAKGFLNLALNAVKEHQGGGSSGGGGQSSISFDGLLGVLSNTIKDTSRDPEGKARMISPEIKDKIGAILRQQHAPLAEQFTRIALDHIKRWLRGNTSTRDLGDGVKGEITELVSGIAGMFGKKSSSSSSGDRSRGDVDDDSAGGSAGFSGVISKKLSTGLAKVHREVRLEFRKVLGVIEKNLFEALPDEVQGPLEKILGGNPFDPSLDAQASPASRGGGDRGSLGDEIKAKLVRKIRDLVRKVQDILRQNVLMVVNGGHRRFERASWVFVQTNVEAKVQRFLPEVRIHVPDDIGNEGVDVGRPKTPPAMRSDGGGGASSPGRPYENQGQNQQGQYQQQGQYHQYQQQEGGGGAASSYYSSPPSQQSYSQQQNQGYGGPPQHQQYYPPPP